MAKHTREELAQWQSLPLEVKIGMTEARIRAWVNTFGQDGVYISFSGGKDSTVLLDIIRNKMHYDQIPAVFVDTGLEYPEIREFVKSFDNVVWLKPEKNFKQVIQDYGYPFISKEVANTVKGAKKGQRTRIEKLMGTNRMKNGELSHFNKKKWRFLLDAPFEIDSYCCDIFKKKPTRQYESKTKRHPFLAQLACESGKRTDAWLHTGCNAFESKRPQSNPMAFWTEQDILEYIVKYDIEICSVYGEVVEDITDTDAVEGQMTISDIEGFEDFKMFDAEKLPLKTTGCSRTGCMFCGFGCCFPDDRRFETMKHSHPQIYQYIMKPWDEGGLGYKEVIDWINEHGNQHIKY